MLLASLVDNDPRLADQETEKLLGFVNYQRPIEYDDVEAVTADTGQGDIFTMVDALGSRDGPRAMGMLQRLLEYQDYYSIFNICAEATLLAGGDDEIVQVANDNCPGQVVISGSRAALNQAISLAQGAGARRAIPLAVSIAAHSPLMSHTQNEFNVAVNSAALDDPSIPVISNVTANPMLHAGEVRTDLQAQLTHRVRWTESIEFMIRQGVTTFLEFGSGSVLIGLLKRI